MTQHLSTSILTDLAKQAVEEQGFMPEFSLEIQKEVNQIIPPPLLPSSTICDLRDKCWFSIDNDESKDLDQLTYVESLSNGLFKIFVAVADVDLLVKTDSAIDLRAQHNTTSIYTPTKVFPMLPLRLSTDLTSLNEGQDRQAVVIEIDIQSDGSLGSYDIYLALVHNKAKLTYKNVGEWLDHGAHLNAQTTFQNRLAHLPGIPQQIIWHDQVAQLIRKDRQAQGALTLDTVEASPVLQQDLLIDVAVAEKNRARNLIEDFMIAANTAMARFLNKHQLPFLQRVVRIPKRWEKIVEIAASFGVFLPEIPNAKALDDFMIGRKKADPASFANLSLTIIKLLGNGEYVVKLPGKTSIGHFDLAIKDYTHSTAPNRRYSDLIIQRLLKTVITPDQGTCYTPLKLELIAKNCTQKEDQANKVERQMKKSAAISLLLPKMGQEFNAIITGANAKGVWVRIYHPFIEGKLIQGFEGLDIGDQIKVKLLHVDMQRGFIDFGRA
jgi:exoribonuclease-2